MQFETRDSEGRRVIGHKYARIPVAHSTVLDVPYVEPTVLGVASLHPATRAELCLLAGQERYEPEAEQLQLHRYGIQVMPVPVGGSA